MSQGKVYPTLQTDRAYFDEQQYLSLYDFSIKNPEMFWEQQAIKYVTWLQPWQQIQTGKMELGDVRWFTGGKLNVCYNCLDRHLPQRAQQVAIIWESDDPNQHEEITYEELFNQVCRFANVLKSYGVQKGDRVCIYLPMIPEAVIAMLACARIGAIHSVVFAGFSAHALQERINDADCRMVITADQSMRGGKLISLKANVDNALLGCPNVHTVIVVAHTGNSILWHKTRDVWYGDAMQKVTAECPIVECDANDPLFILYTSGSTGKPKGVLHGTGGYLLYAAITHHLVFAYRKNDIYWCTADVGWITGHSYIVYGPLANGATTLMYEGIPTYPTASRFWQIIDKHKVNLFYTAPTAIRTLMREGNAAVQSTSRKSLAVMGTVGEPINPEVWEWYYHVVGNQRCPIVDTWWQTETGGILISPMVGCMPMKPGSVMRPFFGIVPGIVDDTGQLLSGAAEGKLVITQPWPGQLLTIYNNAERYLNGYIRPYPGFYFSGDGVQRDPDGDYWITGRVDDVINVSGHRLGTAEIESALIMHPSVAEAGVVGFPHELKGQGIYAFVILMKNSEPSEQMRKELIHLVREQISAIAIPDVIQYAAGLPKTRSGKIMRRILRKIAEGDLENLGDTSTLAEPEIVQGLIQGHQELFQR